MKSLWLAEEGTTSLSKVLRWNSKTTPTEKAVIPVARPLDRRETQSGNVPLDVVGQAKAVAAELIASARRQVDELVRAAEAEAVGLRESARLRGYEAGTAALEAEHAQLELQFAERQAASEADYARRLVEIESLAVAVVTARSEILSRALQPLPIICTEVVQALLGRELAMAPANMEAIIADMLRYLLDSTKVEIRVNPVDYPAATAAHPVWQSAKYGSWELVVVPDSAIRAGGCELRSDVGRLDGTVEVKLASLQSELDAVFGREESQDV